MNREAPTLLFTSAQHEVPRVTNVASLVQQHTPETAMEAEVAALLLAAGAHNAQARRAGGGTRCTGKAGGRGHMMDRQGGRVGAHGAQARRVGGGTQCTGKAGEMGGGGCW